MTTTSRSPRPGSSPGKPRPGQRRADFSISSRTAPADQGQRPKYEQGHPQAEVTKAAIEAERFKILASGIQLIAAGVLGASVIAPIFNNAQRFSLLLAASGGITAALIEFAAWLSMGYAVSRVEIGQEDATA